MTSQVERHHSETDEGTFADGFVAGCQKSVLAPLYISALEDPDDEWNMGFLAGLKNSNEALPAVTMKNTTDVGMNTTIEDIQPEDYL